MCRVCVDAFHFFHETSQLNTLWSLEQYDEAKFRAPCNPSSGQEETTGYKDIFDETIHQKSFAIIKVQRFGHAVDRM